MVTYGAVIWGIANGKVGTATDTWGAAIIVGAEDTRHVLYANTRHTNKIVDFMLNLILINFLQSWIDTRILWMDTFFLLLFVKNVS